MKKLRLIPLILVMCSIFVSGQDKDQSKGLSKEKVALKIQYFGELVLHPGLSIGIDYTLLNSKRVSIHIDTDLGGFWHRWNNSSVFLKSSIGSKFDMGPIFTDITVGLGYMHSWSAGPLFERTENGDIGRAKNNGNPHFIPNASFLIGWDTNNKKNKHSWRAFIGPEAYLQSSYNHMLMPHLAAKIGITLKLF